MSDTQMGPGWWQASDGKWYPPHGQTPIPAPPPPPPPPSGPATTFAHSGQPAVSKGLSGTLQGFAWATGALAAFTMLLTLATLAAFNEFWDTPAGSGAEFRALDDWVEVEDGMVALQGLMWVAWLVAWILLLVWMNQAHKATGRLWHGQRAWSSGWTIGGWFIPVANLLIPKLVLGEVEKIASTPRTDGAADAPWHSRSTSALGWCWWIALVLGFVGQGVGSGLLPDNSLVADPDEIRASYAVTAAGAALFAVAGVLGALHIRKVSTALNRPGVASLAPTPHFPPSTSAPPSPLAGRAPKPPPPPA